MRKAKSNNPSKVLIFSSISPTRRQPLTRLILHLATTNALSFSTPGEKENQTVHLWNSKMSRPNLSEDRDSLDLVPGIQVTIVSSRRTDNVDHGRYGIRTGLAAAPAELIHIVCRLLCLCSYCEPEPNPSPFDLTPLNPVRFRDDLDSLSKTCKFVRDVAQPYLFHVFGPNDRNSTPRLAAKLSAVELPHVANQVRRITLNSVCGELSLLNRLTGLQTLRVMTTRAGGIGLESQLSFPCLKEFFYGGSDLITPMENARKDLRAILSAAENLTHLRCQALWHSSETTPFILLRLPACNITTLELYACWLPHEICKRFLANFVRLENFKLDLTMWLCSDTGLRVPYPEDGPERVADATDGESLPARISQCVCTTSAW